jgi:predicted RNase H-like HicB family nuclease
METPMRHTMVLVRASFDDAAHVWVATSEDVPGLVTEADTLEALRSKLLVVIPELLEANGIVFDLPEIPIHIFAEQTSRIPNWIVDAA